MCAPLALPRRLPPIPALGIAILSVQAGAALARQLFPVVGPLGATGLRVSLAALAMLLVFRPDLRSLDRRRWSLLVPYGLALGAMNLAFYLALERIPLGLAVALEFVGPLGVAILGSRRPADLLWALLAGVGILLLTPRFGGADLDPLGIVLALAAGGCWAVYILVGGRLSRRFSRGGEAAALGMLVSTALLLPVAAPVLARADLRPPVLGIALAVALLSSALPYTLEMVALRALPSRTFGILMSLEPAAATAIGWLLLGERLTPAQWLAVGCVTVASAGAARSAGRQEPPAAAG